MPVVYLALHSCYLKGHNTSATNVPEQLPVTRGTVEFVAQHELDYVRRLDDHFLQGDLRSNPPSNNKIVNVDSKQANKQHAFLIKELKTNLGP